MSGQWVSADLAVVWLAGRGIALSPTTIRVWAHRGHIRADGPRGARYDLAEIEERAQVRAATRRGI